MSDLPMTLEQTAEHERTLLACALHDVDTARKLLGMVQAPMIADGGVARAWSALRRVLSADETGPVYLAGAVAAELGIEGAELHDLTREVPSVANATWYARQVVNAHVRRMATGMLSETDLERNRDRPTADLLAGAEGRLRHLRELLADADQRPLFEDVSKYATAPQPAPVLWRDPDPADPDPGADPDRCDAVLSAGEVAILAAAGGIGKSTLVAAELVSAALTGADLGTDYGAACGLRVVPGPVALVSYEDATVRLARRLTWPNNGKAPPGLYSWPNPPSLWVADADHGAGSRPCAEWEALWRNVSDLGARLVVIDPVSAALADVSTNDTGPVRAFLRALTAEAEAASVGVLLVAHDTKAARNAAARGEDPGAGVVAGSAAWYDGARGVLSLVNDLASDDRLLECVKANYGRTGWGARLIERTGPSGTFRGFELGARLTPADLAATKKAKATAHPPPSAGVGDASGGPPGPGLIP